MMIGENLNRIYMKYIFESLSWEKKTKFKLCLYLEIKISYAKFKLCLYDNGDTFSLFEWHTCQVTHLLQYLMPPLELKYLELTGPLLSPATSNRHLRLLFQEGLIKELNWNLLKDGKIKYTTEIFIFLFSFLLHVKTL